MFSYIKIYDVENRRTLDVNTSLITYIDVYNREIVLVNNVSIITDEESMKKVCHRLGV